MDKEYGASTLSDGLLDAVVVNFERVEARLYEHRLQAVFRDGENRGNIGVGRHDDFIAWLHHAHFDVGTINPDERVKAVGATHTMLRADVLGIMLLESLVFFTLKVPARIDDATHRLVNLVGIFRSNFL